MYYRLKQTDYDGKSEYFPPIIVNCNSDENSMIVYPNPSNGEFAVKVNSSDDLEGAAIAVYDMSGKRLIRQNLNDKAKGTNMLYFSNTQLAPGTYLLVVESEMKNTFKPVKLVIQ